MLRSRLVIGSVQRVASGAHAERLGGSVSGRKDSAEGTLSVTDALRIFSIRAVAATRDERANRDLLSGIVQGRASRFLSTDFIF
jgi:glyceraldehyde-3-phosphate dehydrogenase (NADP+)